eukprot:1817372-Ditylum_brightwellii.AAC.1
MMNNWYISPIPRDFLTVIAVDLLEAFEYVLCYYNQVQQDEVQDEDWISDHPSKRACTGI